MLVCPRCFSAFLSADRCRFDHTRLLRPDQLSGARTVGRFELGEPIAIGRTSRVFRALDTRTRKHVAIKIFHGEIAADRKLAARLAVAAKQQAKLDGKRFVRVIDADLSEHGLAYVARELAGESLAASIHHLGARPPRRVAFLIQEIALALSKLHWGGQTYEDLRPGAVMIGGEGAGEEVRLLEPGALAVLKTAPREVLDPLGGALANPAYLSPEEVAGGKVTTLSDLYVLGVITYELLIGWPPFSTAQAHVDEPVPSIALDYCGLAELARSLLEKDPAKRPQAAAAVLARIERLGISEPPRKRESASGSTGDLPAEPKRSRAPAFLAVSAAAGAIAAGSYLYSVRAVAEKPHLESPPAAVAADRDLIPSVTAGEPEIAAAPTAEEKAADPVAAAEQEAAGATEKKPIAAAPIAAKAEQKAAGAAEKKPAAAAPIAADPAPAAERNAAGAAEKKPAAAPSSAQPPVEQQAAAAAADPVRDAYAAMDLELGRALAERGLTFNDLAAVSANAARQWGRWFKKEPIPSLEVLTATFESLKSSIDAAAKTKTSTLAG